MSEPSNKVRTFVAAPLPGPVVTVLADVQERLRREIRNVSWTGPEAMHLTLRFLGAVESIRLGELTGRLRDAVGSCAVARLELGRAGHFNGRVLWVDVAGETERLGHLADAVREATREFAEKEEDREFRGHITLGRLRVPWRGVETVLAALPPVRSLRWRLEQIELIRSELEPSGARYTILAQVPLRG